MDDERKQDLAGRLAEYPLLRVLLFEKWFRFAFAFFLLVILGGLLFLPKIWVTSPKGFLPVVKVSLLDRAQAWSLKRTARKTAAQGHYDEANYAWQTALANNRADLESLHGLLNNYLEHDRAIKQRRYIVPQALWLLRLTGTNTADLEMAAEVLQREALTEYLAGILEKRKSSLTPKLEVSYLRALFDTGDYRGFAARWEQGHGKVENNPEVRLYRAAYLAGWGPPTESADALKQLDDATQDPGRRNLACRLRLVVSAQRNELAEYKKFLKQLEDWRADTLMEHVGYWKMLVAAGRPARAVELAESYPTPPGATKEVIELARLFVLAGARERALDLFKRYSGEFGNAANFWVSYAHELIQAKKWSALRDLGVSIRSRDAVADLLAGYSYFLEGRAEFGLERPAQADAAFAKMVERGFEFPQLAIRAASELLLLNRPSIALDLLRKTEDDFKNDPNYWGLVFGAAMALKRSDLMVRAAGEAYKLQPTSRTVINNYAAALLIHRQNPEEAIRLTLQLYAQIPSSLPARVNHGAALLFNGRPAEAAALLKTVQTNLLSREQVAMLNLDLLEIQFRLGHLDQARAINESIQEDLLYPSQREWLNKLRQQISETAAPKLEARRSG